MGKYIINFNYGYGDEYEIVEADSQEEAENIAARQWLQGAESQACYGAKPYSQEEAIDLGLEDEPDEEE